MTDINTADSDTPFPTSATFTALTCGTLSLLDDNGLAPLAGAPFTGNVGVAGTLIQGGYNVLTTQYTPPVTDLSGYVQKSGTAFTGNVSVGGTLTPEGWT